jgi:DNA-binding MarR family transcriptional regulator
VTARLSRIGPLLARRQEEIFGRFGLNRGEVGALGALRIAGPPHQLSPTRLSKGLMLSSAGITSRIDRLERRGLVHRLPDPDDRRGVIIELTDRGLEVVDAAVAALTISDACS